MKRLLAILMVLALLVSACLLTACGDDSGDKDDKKDKTSTTAAADGEDKPADDGENKPADDNKPADKADLYTIVKNAMDKTDAYTSGEMHTTATITGDVMGNQIGMDTTWVLKMNGDKLSLAGNVKSTEYGETMDVDVECYFDGSYIYILTMDMGYKMPCTAEEFAEEYAADTEVMFTDLPKALFEGLEGDGTTVVLTLDEATCEQLFGDIITELCYDIVGEDLNQVTTTGGKVTLSVQNDVLASYKMEFTCTMGSGSATATYTYVQTIELVNMGGNVTVTPMEGYEDFALMDEY